MGMVLRTRCLCPLLTPALHITFLLIAEFFYSVSNANIHQPILFIRSETTISETASATSSTGQSMLSLLLSAEEPSYEEVCFQSTAAEANVLFTFRCSSPSHHNTISRASTQTKHSNQIVDPDSAELAFVEGQTITSKEAQEYHQYMSSIAVCGPFPC
ncbi:MAG: hypothetical protein J3R72DRAFT_476165 [Linnemannia gamsii]|nr:MAG: hypothetical protein J3R72DRAFT_476165 [Linnemannia gamsii]